MSIPCSYVKEARAAWRLLNGVFCVYKPTGMSSRRLMEEVRNKLSLGLNAMKVREPEKMVEINRIEGNNENKLLEVPMVPKLGRGSELEKFFTKEVVAEIPDGPDTIQILKGSNYADLTLVVGPRYQTEDIRLYDISRLGVDTSGLSVLGINRGISTVRTLHNLRWLRTYILSGKFGFATNTGFHTGRIIDKATFHRIKKPIFERLLDSTQAAHQKNMFSSSGVTLKSERAYEIASQGHPRPENSDAPLIYSLKCTKFALPDFEIEMAVVNENEDFLKTLIHDFGLRLHSAAMCTKLRCIKYGPFTLDLALLPKHFDPQHVINNTIRTAELLNMTNMRVRDPLISNESADRAPKIPSVQETQRKIEYI